MICGQRIPVILPSENVLEHSVGSLTALTSLTLVRRWGHPGVVATLLPQLPGLLRFDLRSAFDEADDKGAPSESVTRSDARMCRFACCPNFFPLHSFLSRT